MDVSSTMSGSMAVIEIADDIIEFKTEPDEILAGERSESDEEFNYDEEFDKSSLDSDEDWVASSPDSETKPEKRADENSETSDNVLKFDLDGIEIQTDGNYSKCPTCGKKIKSTFILRHIKLHAQPAESFPCPEKNCSLIASRINNLFRHLKMVHKSKKPYICKHSGCTEKFSKPNLLKEHFASHREERRRLHRRSNSDDDADSTKTYRCEFPECGKEYGKRHHLKEHERKHTGDMRFVCDVCGKKFYIQAHMKRHLYSHTGIKPHTCRWKCGAIFASYGGRIKHERITHYESNPLESECDICGRPFRNQQQLAKHRMTHLNPAERADYRCSFCGIMLDTIRLRERHEERHRDGETFTCETCQKSFKNEKNLNHHIKKHHTGEEKNEIKATTETESGNKPEKYTKYPCHICGPSKLFCLTSLRRHLARIHSQNFKCDRQGCGKGFKEKSQFDAHMEIHRMRECHLCGKKFQRKQNADIHLMGVHNLTTKDLETLGRWKCKTKDTSQCPEYMVRTIKCKKKTPSSPSSKGGDTNSEAVAVEEMIDIKPEPLSEDDCEITPKNKCDEKSSSVEGSESQEQPLARTEPSISYIVAHGPNGIITLPTYR